ncbi:unnamed protein product [Effrenium voratum]|uniref:Uncharacterized protein n=1 Tax=Effrenium voratum TaxID=2562239 RepID=A0AA36J449_9DINO|nr:unnamed protein product [Effrenium voratum]CAJ1440255.1 unnamed protein product [Effrenium voratum]CAJ1440256.1 unnamed protein product [Effrenium voratum]
MPGPDQEHMSSMSSMSSMDCEVSIELCEAVRTRRGLDSLDSLDTQVDEEKGQEIQEFPRPAGQVATVLYLALALGHLLLIQVQWQGTATEGSLFLVLSGLQVCLAFEAAVYAAGGFSWLPFLEAAGRMRLLLGATAWAWLLPWAAELHCRCRPAPGTALLATQQGYALAYFVSAFFALREICFVLRGEPPSALDRSQQPRLGDCLPSNAVLGGQFRLDKAELEETGRAVFVPSRARSGLGISSGLALVAHLAAGLALRPSGWPGWLLSGGLVALLARRFGTVWDLWDAKGSKLGAHEVPRLVCRAGEFCWLLCALWQLRACEAEAGGALAECK